MEFREASALDIPAMARIRSFDWGTEEYWNTRIEGYMSGQLHPQKALMARILFVATEKENVVGLIAGHLTSRFNCDGELEWISVLAQYRRKGVARKLIQLLAGWFIEKNSFRICVDVDPANTSAQQFYKKHGAEVLNKHWLVWNDVTVVLTDQ